MKHKLGLLLMVLGWITLVGCAPLPVLNVDHEQVMRLDGKPMTMADMDQVLRIAAYEEEWELQPDSPGHVIATKRSGNDWKLRVDILYTPTDFSLHYKDSVGLQYNPLRGTIAKHGRGVMEDLRDRIKDEVQMLTLRGG